ncbi:hypothetical protein QFC20_007252 [Naganishia adeliensis]|uniref:Uncharacterized protein n=1 Tax=Naganishia adeliensis TaxID=92952 RepID=A0ACC2V1J3_9TREE|nr:hypothetical protein QFC20_007252 [Naganishia adeliensis]
MADAPDDDSGAVSPTSPPPLDTAQLPAKRKIACLACRTIKLRCLFAAADSAPLDPCRRCKRLDLVCVYQPKRRPVKPVQQAQQQVEAGKQEVRTESPFEQDLVLGNEENRQMSNNSSSSRTPYFPGQPQQHVSGPPNKRRRLPGSEPGIAGDEYGQFMPSLPDIYDGYPGQGRMPQMMVGNGAGNGAEHSGMIDVDRKFMPSENPFIPMDPALDPFRSREPPTYLDPQQEQHQRNWSLMHDQSGAMQQSQQIQLQHPSLPSTQTQMHRHSLPNARPGTAGTHGIVRAQDFAAHPAGEVVTGAVVTPGSMTEGSVGTTGTTGAGIAVSGSTSASQQHARPTTSGGTSGNRGKGKIMYTQPLSISPSGMSGGSGPPLSAVSGGFHTSSERSTRHGPEHAGYAHLPHQVAHPQTAPAYREYGSYLSYERDVHDVGAGPIVVGPSSSESGGSDPARALLAPLPERSGDGVGQGDGVRGDGGGGDDAERRAMMRNSMALTSILDDMKKDLGGPPTSSERDRNRHHHHSHGNGQRDGAGKDRQDGARHAADYVTQEGSLDSRRDHSDTGSGGGGGSAQMDIGERYNAMDIAEREQRLASALDVGSVGIGGGGPIGLDIVPPNGSNTTATTNRSEGRVGRRERSIGTTPRGARKRNFRGRVGIVDDDLRARQRERELQRLESEKTEGMEDPVTLGILDQDDVAFLFECFHEKFNAYIAILDPALHTPHYVLKTCPILHTAICTVTAQTYAPEQYKVLLKRANFMLGKAFERGDQDIGIVQALSILSCWKEPHDKGGWLRLGYAIRMGYELGLDQPPQRPLPKDRLRALEVLRMIRTETQHWIENWITDHPEVYCYADGMLAASYPTGEMIINLRQSTPSYMEDDVGFRVMLHRTKTDIAAWRERWFGEQPLAFLHPISAAIIGFYAIASDWEVADFCYRNVPKSRIPEHLADATSKAMKLLRYIVTDLAPGEIMVFAPDVITVRAARSAVFLTRLVPQLDPSVVEEIYNIFRDVVRECRRHSRGQNTTYHLAKFFASLIKISSVGPTRSASRIQTPEEGSQESQPAAVSGEALTAKLNEAAEGNAADRDAVPQDFFQNDENLFVFDDSVDPLSIDALLQESQDWFSADLMAQINSDGGWNPLPVFPLPDNFHML